MIDKNSERNARGRKVLLTVLVVGIMVATAFAVTAQVLHRSRAEMLSQVPLQWQKYVNGAIENGEISKSASPLEVKNWLANRIPGMSDKVKNSWVNPLNAKAVAEREAALGTSSPEPPAITGTGKILVILVEFTGTDTFHGVTYTGPMHNQMPQPPPEDNVNYWVSDYNQQHYVDMLFGSNGYTLANFYKEQSGGLFTVGGYVTAWVQITDHSEWWYGADSRTGGEGSDDLNGPTWRLAIDATKAAWDTYGTAIPWADFDTNGDGWIDSLMVVRGGSDQSSDAPAWYVWAHSWFVDWPNGYEINSAALPGLKIGSYTTEPESEAVGVYAHEYGHQLGLPDEYDITYIGESQVGFLSLMASGSWGPGPTPDGRMALGVSPCHMTVWEKYVLGWESGATMYLNYDGKNPVSGRARLSEVEGTGSLRAVKVELPTKQATLPIPAAHSGSLEWYSWYKADFTDTTDTQEYSDFVMQTAVPIAVPAGGATLSFWEWFDIEEYWDYAYVQASNDGGLTWTSLPGKQTTDRDPNGVNLGNGITGSSRRYVAETMDLSGYAGMSVLIRFMLSQDSSVSGFGWLLDDISVTASGEVLFSDMVDVGSESLWLITAVDHSGPGWGMVSAPLTAEFRHYYIMEWRNFVGFDKTLSTSYQFVGLYVQFWSHTPGLLIWYRDFATNDNMVGLHPGRVALGVVDAHPEPLLNAFGNYIRQRLQLMDAAFGLRSTVANTITLSGVSTTYPSLPAAKTFDDSKQFFYYQVVKGSYQYEGLKVPTYGVKATVLSEKAGLVGATISIDAAPLV